MFVRKFQEIKLPLKKKKTHTRESLNTTFYSHLKKKKKRMKEKEKKKKKILLWATHKLVHLQN